MKLELNGWRAAIAIASAIVIGLVAQPASARDRPGTPNNLTLRDCGVENNAASICGVFGSTASEEVIIESIITENNHPISPGVTLGCQQQEFHNPGIQVIPCIGTVPIRYGDVQFELRGAKFGSTYCVKLRARRRSDQVVSEIWSAPSCFTTAPLPPVPAAPDIQVQYTGSIWVNGHQIPQQVHVAIPTLDRFTSATVGFSPLSGVFTSNNPTAWVYNVRQGDDLITITMCKQNPAGKNCASKVVSILHQSDMQINGQTIKHTGRPKPST